LYEISIQLTNNDLVLFFLLFEPSPNLSLKEETSTPPYPEGEGLMLDWVRRVKRKEESLFFSFFSINTETLALFVFRNERKEKLRFDPKPKPLSFSTNQRKTIQVRKKASSQGSIQDSEHIVFSQSE